MEVRIRRLLAAFLIAGSAFADLDYYEDSVPTSSRKRPRPGENFYVDGENQRRAGISGNVNNIKRRGGAEYAVFDSGGEVIELGEEGEDDEDVSFVQSLFHGVTRGFGGRPRWQRIRRQPRLPMTMEARGVHNIVRKYPPPIPPPTAKEEDDEEEEEDCIPLPPPPGKGKGGKGKGEIVVPYYNYVPKIKGEKKKHGKGAYAHTKHDKHTKKSKKGHKHGKGIFAHHSSYIKHTQKSKKGQYKFEKEKKPKKGSKRELASYHFTYRYNNPKILKQKILSIDIEKSFRLHPENSEGKEILKQKIYSLAGLHPKKSKGKGGKGDKGGNIFWHPKKSKGGKGKKRYCVPKKPSPIIPISRPPSTAPSSSASPTKTIDPVPVPTRRPIIPTRKPTEGPTTTVLPTLSR